MELAIAELEDDELEDVVLVVVTVVVGAYDVVLVVEVAVDIEFCEAM